MADKITSVIAKEENGNIQITFTIPFSIIKESQDETLKELAKDVEVPGFRKGMAPIAKAAEKIPQGTLIEHSLSHLLPKALGDAITENKLRLAVYPKFELLSAKDGEAWQIRGITCELPEVTLGEYKKEITGALRADTIIVPGKDGAKIDNSPEASREKKEQIVIKTLLEKVKITIPLVLIEEEADSRISSLLARLEKLGLALESYLAQIGKKPEDLRAEYAKQAKEAISIDLILSKIAEEEKIAVDPKEVETAIKISQSAASKAETTESEMESKKRLVESILKRRGALDFLITLG